MADKVEESDLADDIALAIADLNLTQTEYFLDEVDVHIQENLEDDLVQEALGKGLDLREYSKQIERDLREVENASIQDYMEQSENIASLHQHISNCDHILQSMEEMLQGFQSDLGSISDEIQNLQDQSVAMNVKLKNRQAVRGELSQFVDEMAVPEYLINTILDVPVTERQFVEQLHELDHKIRFVKQQSFNDAKACLDVKDVLDKLKHKAVGKIREFLLQKIYQFRKPLTNYQVPQNSLLKFRFFYEFLLANERHVAKEVKEEYVETMCKILYSYFRSYISKLNKLQFEEQAEKDDLMGTEDTAKKSFFATKPALKNRASLFTLGDRGDMLTNELETPIIVPHAAQKTETKYSFEKLFRSLHFAQMDNACREYLFITDFFILAGQQAMAMFYSIMLKSTTITLKHVDAYVSESFDAIAIFLCIHIVLRYQVIMHDRQVPALDEYWKQLLSILWPRFEEVVRLNIHSIHEADPSKMNIVDTRPHYITRRYAEFSAALVSLNENFPSERVERLLSALQQEMENFVMKVAAEFTSRKKQLISLINNYDLMLNVIMQRTTDDSKESDSFKQHLASKQQEFVDQLLEPRFGGMIKFVKEAENLIENGMTEQLKGEERTITIIVRSFAGNWKKGIEELNGEVVREVANFNNGTQILQAALSQMIQYYHRFQKILSQEPFKHMPIRSELVNIHNLMVEVKKSKSLTF